MVKVMELTVDNLYSCANRGGSQGKDKQIAEECNQRKTSLKKNGT